MLGSYGPLPAVAVSWGTGGSWGEFVEAFAHDARQRAMVRLPWNGEAMEAKEIGQHDLAVDSATRTVIVIRRPHDAARHNQSRVYQSGRMERIRSYLGPWPEDLMNMRCG